jgi:streptogramin lyase
MGSPSIVKAASPGEELERLGEPCRAFNILAGACVNVAGGAGCDLALTNMNEASGLELLLVPQSTGPARRISAPSGQGAWALAKVQGARLVLGTFYDASFLIFDLVREEFIKRVSVPGESYIWDLAVSSNGNVIYAGTYPGGKLVSLDLTDFTMKDYGAPSTGNEYLRHVSTLPDGRILCSFGFAKPDTQIFDPSTNTFSLAPTSLQGIPNVLSWHGRALTGSTVLDGTSLLPVAESPIGAPFEVLDGPSSEETLFLQKGTAVFRYRDGDTMPTWISDGNIHGGRFIGATSTGSLLAVRGQSLLTLDLGSHEAVVRPIPLVSKAREALFLRLDARGNLWTGPPFGQTLTRLSPSTGSLLNTDAVSDAMGEVCDIVDVGGRIFAASYAGGEILEFDPGRPWNQIGGSNPRSVARLDAKGYVRPSGGLSLGPDGLLYSGWMAKYGTYGGAVAITDPASLQTRLIENPLGPHAIEGLAVDDRFVYVGTSTEANGLAHATDVAPELGVMTLDGGGVIALRERFPGATVVRDFALDRATHLLAFAVDHEVHVLEAAAVVRGFPMAPSITSRSMAVVAPGRVMYGSHSSIVLLDLRTGEVDRVAEAPVDVSNVASDESGNSFASAGTAVYRVRLDPSRRLPVTPSVGRSPRSSNR